MQSVAHQSPCIGKSLLPILSYGTDINNLLNLSTI